MSIFREIQQLFSKPLQEIAIVLGYPDSTICVLSGSEVAVKTKYPAIYNNIQSCRHNRDARTPMQYALDLAASWVMEDYIIGQLKNNGLSVSRAGKDKERIILPDKNVSSNSDCLVEYDGKSRHLELMNDYKGYWNRYKRWTFVMINSSNFKMKNHYSLVCPLVIKNTYCSTSPKKPMQFIAHFTMHTINLHIQ